MRRGRRGGPQGIGDQELHGGGVQSKATRQHPWGVSGRLHEFRKEVWASVHVSHWHFRLFEAVAF